MFILHYKAKYNTVQG